MKFEDTLKKIKFNNFKNNFFEMLAKKGRFLFSIFFILSLAYAGYLWYASIYSFSWDENKKQEYVDSKSSKENFFNKNKFEKVVSGIERRKIEYQKPTENPRDIFGIE